MNISYISSTFIVQCTVCRFNDYMHFDESLDVVALCVELSMCIVERGYEYCCSSNGFFGTFPKLPGFRRVPLPVLDIRERVTQSSVTEFSSFSSKLQRIP